MPEAAAADGGRTARAALAFLVLRGALQHIGKPALAGGRLRARLHGSARRRRGRRRRGARARRRLGSGLSREGLRTRGLLNLPWRALLRDVVDAARAPDDLRQFVQRIDLIADDAAQRRRLLGGLARQLLGAAAQLRPRRLEILRHLLGEAADFRRRRVEALARLVEHLRELLRRLLIGGVQRLSRALALLFGRGADLREAFVDDARRLLRGLRQKLTDVLRARLRVTEAFLQRSREGAEGAQEVSALLLDQGDEREERIAARLDRRVEILLALRELGDAAGERRLRLLEALGDGFGAAERAARQSSRARRADRTRSSSRFGSPVASRPAAHRPSRDRPPPSR